MSTLVAQMIDVLVVALGAITARRLRYGEWHVWSDTEALLVAFTCVLSLLVFTAFGVYRSWRGKRAGELVARAFAAWLLALTVGLVIAYSLHRSEAISRVWFGIWAINSCLGLLVTKCLIRFVLGRLRSGGLNQKPVAIIGTGGHCSELLERVRGAPESGFLPVCVFDETHASGRYLAGIPVLSNFETLATMVKDRRIREIWLAVPLSDERHIFRIVRAFRNDFVNIRLIPDTRSLTLFSHSIVDLMGLPAINLAATQFDDPQVVAKLIFDRVFAVFILLLLLPLLVSIAISIKFDSPGPVLFKQKRKGMDGREFDILKFRSMKVHREVEGRITQARKTDDRITRVGRLLRRTSLDELPQFFNVLRGDMSVVGPRPHALAHDDQYKDLVEGYMYRYRIKPGITGWAQVNGFRGETDEVHKMASRVQFDLYYIQHWNFWFDMKIVFMTIAKGFIGVNAY